MTAASPEPTQNAARSLLLSDTVRDMDAGDRMALSDFLKSDKLPTPGCLSRLCRAGLMKWTTRGYFETEGVRGAVALHKAKALQSGEVPK
jgi:hypothetical protein